jgi:hypothetical protein
MKASVVSAKMPTGCLGSTTEALRERSIKDEYNSIVFYR